eukprot:907647_1
MEEGSSVSAIIRKIWYYYSTILQLHILHLISVMQLPIHSSSAAHHSAQNSIYSVVSAPTVVSVNNDYDNEVDDTKLVDQESSQNDKHLLDHRIKSVFDNDKDDHELSVRTR